MRMNETEQELITMVLSGRTEAFEPLVTPYRGPILALAYRLTRDREDAREVAQEAFLKAFRSLDRFDLSRSFRNWLFQIAANEARDRLRRAKRERAAFEAAAREGTAAAPAPEAGRERRETRSGILRALDALAQASGVFVLRPPRARHPGNGARSRLLERLGPGQPVLGPPEDPRGHPARFSPFGGSPMTCRKARKLLPLFAGDDLGPRRTQAVRAHVDACPACRRELEEIRDALAHSRPRRRTSESRTGARANGRP
jgi:RNA polymerase sigma factor (sigma-70 family)